MNKFILNILFTMVVIHGLSAIVYSQSEKITDTRRAEVQAIIDSINNQIKQKGFKWKAGFNALSFYSDEQLKNLCGEFYDPSKVKTNLAMQDSMYNAYISNYNKTSMLVNTIPDWKSYMNTPESQSPSCGNCWAYACTGVLEGLLNYYLGYSFNLDEDFLTDHGCSGCQGGDPTCGFGIIENFGVRSTSSINGNYYKNARYKVSNYSVQSPTDIESIKLALITSPVYASMYVYHDFYFLSSDPDYIYRHAWGDKDPGKHAIVIVGYNDNEQYWICKNSWGPNWANHGYFKIAYGECGIDELNCGTAEVNQSSLAKIVPTLINDLSTALNNSFGLGEYAYVIGYNYLYGNPDPISYKGTLLVKNGSTIDLNGFQLLIGHNMYNEWGNIIIEDGGQILYSSELIRSYDNQMIGYLPLKFSSDYTISNGYEMKVKPGTTLKFATNKSLTVNGILNAVGASSNPIIFDRISSSGSWGGIHFNSCSSGNVQYCNIKNASVGITCNYSLPLIKYNTISNNSTGISVSNIATPSNDISFNTIQDNSSSGINLYYASPKIYNNIISNNHYQGISCYNSSPYLYGNTISGHVNYGLSCSFYSNAHLVPWNAYGSYWGSGHNVIKDNYVAEINADYNCNLYLGNSPYGGYNSIYDNFSSYEMKASYNCNIMAENNWWGSNPQFYTNQSTFDYTPQLTQDPNNSQNNSAVSTLLSSNMNSNSELDKAYFLQLEGKFEEAITIYDSYIKENPNDNKSAYALIRMNECYQLSGKKEFTNYLDNTIKNKVITNADLHVASLELRNQYLIQNKNFQEALTNFNLLAEKYRSNSFVEKYSIFNAGYIYLEYLHDLKNAEEKFNELFLKYPDDDLVLKCKNLLGEENVIETSPIALNKISNPGTKNPKNYELYQNFPNPFNPTTTISYQIPQKGLVDLKVYNILGQEIAVIVNKIEEAGIYNVQFDSSKLPSGVYIYSIRVNNFNSSKKMILMK